MLIIDNSTTANEPNSDNDADSGGPNAPHDQVAVQFQRERSDAYQISGEGAAAPPDANLDVDTPHEEHVRPAEATNDNSKIVDAVPKRTAHKDRPNVPTAPVPDDRRGRVHTVAQDWSKVYVSARRLCGPAKAE